MTKPKVPKQLDAVTDIVLAYRPTAKSQPAVQRKRRRTILAKQWKCEICGTPTKPPMVRCQQHLQRGDPWTA